MTSIIRYANVVMVVVFLLSVAVQYNDPDGIWWMALYGAAAGLSVAFVFGRLRWHFAAGLAVISAVWALMLYPEFAGRVTPQELVDTFTMKTAVVEYAREAGGLGIVCAWMAVLAVSASRRDLDVTDNG